MGEAPPNKVPAVAALEGPPPVSLSAAVIAFTPEPGAISLVGGSAEFAPPLVSKIRCNNWAICLEPDSKAYLLARRLIPSWIAARVTKVARVSARFS